MGGSHNVSYHGARKNGRIMSRGGRTVGGSGGERKRKSLRELAADTAERRLILLEITIYRHSSINYTGKGNAFGELICEI
jgi:hypothetical protein